MFKKNNNVNVPVRRYTAARSGLLLMMILTVVNTVQAALGSESYFVFSDYLAYLCAVFGRIFYEESGGESLYLIVFCAMSALILLPYLLCWIFSKKHRGWMVAALILFVLDTALMFVLYDISYMIVDLLIHAWVLYYLITGTAAIKKLNQQPAEITCPEIAPEQPVYDPAAAPADEVMVNGLPINADPEE